MRVPGKDTAWMVAHKAWTTSGLGGYRVFLKKTSTEGCLCATRYEVDWEVVFEDVKELKVQGKKD